MKLLLSVGLFRWIHLMAYCYSPSDKRNASDSNLFRHTLLSQFIGLLTGWLWVQNVINFYTVMLLLINLYVFFTDFYYRLIPLKVHFFYLLFMRIDGFHSLFLLSFLLVLLYFTRINQLGLGDVFLLGSSGMMLDTYTFNKVLLTACLLGILYYFLNKNTHELPFGSFWVLALSLLMNY